MHGVTADITAARINATYQWHYTSLLQVEHCLTFVLTSQELHAVDALQFVINTCNTFVFIASFIGVSLKDNCCKVNVDFFIAPRRKALSYGTRFQGISRLDNTYLLTPRLFVNGMNHTCIP